MAAYFIGIQNVQAQMIAQNHFGTRKNRFRSTAKAVFSCPLLTK